jgi:hypothetical protein
MKRIPESIQKALCEPYPLTADQRAHYERDQCVLLPGFWPKEVLEFVEPVITHLVQDLTREMPDLTERDTYGQAFRQAFNLWTHDPRVRAFIFSPRVGGVMNELLGCASVRLYHDQALFKEPGGGITPWHADQYYWPMDSARVATMWMPLHEVPLEMGPLEFARGSHVLTEGRNLEISADSEARIGSRMRIGDFPMLRDAYALGTVSVHSGWVFHRASPNASHTMRKVMTGIYMDAEMRASRPTNSHQQADLDQWCPGVAVGEVLDTPLNPIL